MYLYLYIESVQNLGSIWDNEDLSTGEKLLQTVMSLSMAFGGLAQSIPLMQKAFSQIRNNKIWSSLNEDIFSDRRIEKRKKKKYVKKYTKAFKDQDTEKLDEERYANQYQGLEKSKEYEQLSKKAVDKQIADREKPTQWSANEAAKAQRDANTVKAQIESNKDLIETNSS